VLRLDDDVSIPPSDVSNIPAHTSFSPPPAAAPVFGPANFDRTNVDPFSGLTTFFERARAALFSDSMSDYDAINACIDMPATRGSCMAYLPGLHPINNRCAFCGKEFLFEVKRDNRELSESQGKPSTNAQHILTCALKRSLEYAEKSLITTYPSTSDTPLVAKSNSTRGTNMHVLAFRLQKRGYPFQCGISANCGQILSLSLARTHFATHHGLWIPPGSQSRQSYRASGAWDIGAADFPVMYWHSPPRIIADPVAIESFCKSLFKTRIQLEGSTKPVRYGHRLDVSYPAHFDQGRTENRPPDSKYELLIVDGILKQPGICFFCAHSTSLSFTDRMRPWYFRDPFIAHRASCANRLIKSAINNLADVSACEGDTDGLEELDDDTFVVDGEIVCPDPVCLGTSIAFATILDLVQHLAVVHLINREAPETKAVKFTLAPLEQYTFLSEESLMEWVNKGSKALEAKRKAREIKASSVDQAGKPSTTAVASGAGDPGEPASDRKDRVRKKQKST
jgi:hypothetical protein